MFILDCRVLSTHNLYGNLIILHLIGFLTTLKSLLHERREKNLDTWVLFIDLVKAYDSVQHEMIRKALEILGAPSNLIRWTMKLYCNFSVVLKIGSQELSIPYGCGVKQGDSLAPLLFCMVF